MLGVATRILIRETQDRLDVRRNRCVRFSIVISGASLYCELRKGRVNRGLIVTKRWRSIQSSSEPLASVESAPLAAQHLGSMCRGTAGSRACRAHSSRSWSDAISRLLSAVPVESSRPNGPLNRIAPMAGILDRAAGPMQHRRLRGVRATTSQFNPSAPLRVRHALDATR